MHLIGFLWFQNKFFHKFWFLKYEVSWFGVCHNFLKQMVFTPMEACNIELNYYSNHDTVSEHKFRVYSNIEILDCPSGAYIFKVLISRMVRNYEMFL